MKTLSSKAKENLKCLNGAEVYSVWNYEGTVYVKGTRVFQGGKQIDTLDTEEKIQALFDELFENEFGGTEFYF